MQMIDIANKIVNQWDLHDQFKSNELGEPDSVKLARSFIKIFQAVDDIIGESALEGLPDSKKDRLYDIYEIL
jgi:hypothetical protein